MANPKTPIARARREEQLHIRVSVAQKAVLAEAAGRMGLDVSAWLRSLGMREAATMQITEASVAARLAEAAPEEKPAPTTGRKGRASARAKG